ncbi:MAG: hypothetical protein GY759_09170 [Chloroflexi bacterium]|nr:hypothetical protein [Chloroflexota bacterium]
MEWVVIVTTIMELIQRCREDRDKESIELLATGNRPLGRYFIRRELRRVHGIRGAELRDAMQQVRDHEMDDDDVCGFIDDALDD